MEPNKAEFYRLFFNELQKKQSRNSPDAKAFEEKLFGLIGTDLDNSARLEKIETHVRKISNKFDVIDKESEQRARSFYKDFPTTTPQLTELKAALIKSYELFDMNQKREDHKQAAKYAIIQLEGVLNLLEPRLIEWEEKNPTREYSQLRYIVERGGKKSMPFLTKCSSVSAFLNTFINFKRIQLTYDIRNYESHQFLPDKVKDSEDKLKQLKDYPTDYYGEVFTLLKKCFPALV